MQFDGTQQLIGTGAQAEVLLYEGYAYKVYKPTYPAEWIAFEKSQQKAVNDAGLCSVRYYDTDDEHIIKMDFVDGEMLEKRALTGDITCFKILSETGIAAGVRRIEALTAANLLQYYREMETRLAAAAAVAKTIPDELEKKIGQFQSEIKALHQENEQLKAKTEEFKKRQGSYICRQILSYDISTDEGRNFARANLGVPCTSR